MSLRPVICSASPILPLGILGTGLNMLRFTLVGSGVPVKREIPPTQENTGLQNAVFRREHVVKALFSSPMGESVLLGLAPRTEEGSPPSVPRLGFRVGWLGSLGPHLPVVASNSVLMLLLREPKFYYVHMETSPRTLPFMDALPRLTIFPLRLLVLSLIIVSRLYAPDCLLVSYAGKRWCSFRSMSAKPADMKISALHTCVVKYSCPSDPWDVTVNGTGRQVPCGFPVCLALMCLGPLHGPRPSDPRTNQISPEPCLQPSPIISTSSVIFRRGV